MKDWKVYFMLFDLLIDELPSSEDWRQGEIAEKKEKENTYSCSNCSWELFLIFMRKPSMDTVEGVLVCT